MIKGKAVLHNYKPRHREDLDVVMIKSHEKKMIKRRGEFNLCLYVITLYLESGSLMSDNTSIVEGISAFEELEEA